MLIQRILTFVMLSIMLTACGGPDTANNAANSTGDVAVTPLTTPSTTPATTTDVNAPNAKGEPAQNSVGVWHYTCSNGCEGGAGTAMPCPKCGTTLAHNSAYHSGGAASTTPTIATPPPTLNQPAANNPFASPAITPTAPVGNTIPKAPEPPQNSQGVWHYTCPKGCDGGGGSAVACSKCGTTLAHNTAYHN